MVDCKRRGAVALLAVVLAAGVASGQDALSALLPEQLEQGRLLQERFELFNRCRPMWLLVEELPEDASAIGLTEDAIRATAESRLRAARLYQSEERWLESPDKARLNVTVSFLASPFRRLNQRQGTTFGASLINVDFWRRLPDPRNGTSGMALTWRNASVYGVTDNSGSVLSFLSQELDRFLADYLRVNEAHCL